MYGIIPIIIGIIILLNYKRLLDYQTHLNDRSGKPVGRQIMIARLIAATTFLIIIGIIMIIKTSIK